MPKFPKLLALAAIAPFILAFAPPEEPGTTVSVSGGTGRFVSASGCSRPRLVETTEQQVGVHHQWAHGGDKRKRYGVGAEANFVQSREKECTEEDCRNPGWKDNPTLGSLTVSGTLDWHWFGTEIGGQLAVPRKFEDSVGHNVYPTEWLGFPLRGALRLGYPDRIYVSLEVLDGQPLLSGSTFPIGVGGRMLGTDVWLAPYPDYEELGVSARVARQFGPVRIRLSGRIHEDERGYSRSDWDDGTVIESFKVSVPEYGLAAGIDYHLPW